MAGPSQLPQLTTIELDLMKVLWTSGSMSAREVHAAVAEERGWAYSTTRTNLERMVHKGLVGKHRFHGLHIYQPKISRPQGLARRVKQFAEQILEMNHSPVVALFTDSEALSPAEVEELRELLDQGENE